MYGPKTPLTRCLQCAEKVISYNRSEIENAPLFCSDDCEQGYYENNNVPSSLRLLRTKNPGYAVFTVTSPKGFARVRINFVWNGDKKN